MGSTGSLVSRRFPGVPGAGSASFPIKRHGRKRGCWLLLLLLDAAQVHRLTARNRRLTRHLPPQPLREIFLIVLTSSSTVRAWPAVDEVAIIAASQDDSHPD